MKQPPAERDPHRRPNALLMLAFVAAALFMALLALRASSSGAASWPAAAGGEPIAEASVNVGHAPPRLLSRLASPPLADDSAGQLPDASADAFAGETEPPKPVSLVLQPECKTAGDCGRGGFCSDGRCLGCKEDGDCGLGRACAFGLCLRTANVACRAHEDCASGQLCTVTVPDDDPSDVERMRSACAGGGPMPIADERL